MIENFHITKGYTFMTSLDVIREVMNVPMEAVHAIARMNDISTADDHEKNISENELRPFTEAFERKTRNYFVNSMRNSAQLSPEELQTFTEFCKTFKKGNVSLDKVSNWSHIGKTKLRQYFVDKIKEKTPSSPIHHANSDLFAGCGGGIEALISRVLCIDIESGFIPSGYMGYRLVWDSECRTIEYRRQPSRDLLCLVSSDWRYHAKIESNVCHEVDIPDSIRQVMLFARYYIYTDDEYHIAC